MYNKIAKQICYCQLCNDNYSPLIVINKAIVYPWQFVSSVFKRKDRNKLVSAAIQNTRGTLYPMNNPIECGSDLLKNSRALINICNM